jgi:DNA-binding CsgD family transcriptional regulator
MSIHLTKRQEEVLQIIQMGASNKQIARRLGIAESTVKLHVTALLSKFAVQTRNQLALYSTKGYTPSLPVPPVLEENPAGWVKRVGKNIRGVVFSAQPPDDTWEPIYIKRS